MTVVCLCSVSDPGCIAGTTGSKDWLQKNFGDFADYAPLEDLQKLNGNFSGVSALHHFLIVNVNSAVSFLAERTGKGFSFACRSSSLWTC